MARNDAKPATEARSTSSSGSVAGPSAAALADAVNGDVFERFDERFDNLCQWEDESGALLIGESRWPSMVVRVTLTEGGLTHEEVPTQEVNLRQARLLNSPETASNPQYD